MTRWRFLSFENYPGPLNMGIDEALMESVSQGGLPSIRLYGWSPSCVSIGCFQSMDAEVDLEYCKKNNISCVRRKTGGGAVYHDFQKEVTYSVIAPVSMFSHDIIKSYKEICGWVEQGLLQLDLRTEFRPINDIIFNDKKISGNAQTRRDGVLLQHGTILYDLDVEAMFTALKVPKEKISDKMIQSVKDRVTCIKNHSSASFSELIKALEFGFTFEKEFIRDSLTQTELERAKDIASFRYSSNEWNLSR